MSPTLSWTGAVAFGQIQAPDATVQICAWTPRKQKRSQCGCWGTAASDLMKERPPAMSGAGMPEFTRCCHRSPPKDHSYAFAYRPRLRRALERCLGIGTVPRSGYMSLAI